MKLGFAVFDQVTQLDLTGPAQVLSRLPHAELFYVGETLDPVMTDCGFAIVPTSTLETCPRLDLICVPGGYGVAAVMGQPAWLEFIARQARSARHVTSVCTGAFILGAAGLLSGKRATTHWAYHDLLTIFGAFPVTARTVTDGPIITGGGVTAGIDFGLTVLAQLGGRELAQATQLALEYDPSLPLDTGSPARVPDLAGKLLKGPFSDRRAVMERASREAVARLA